MSYTNNRESADHIPVPTIGSRTECPPSSSDGTQQPVSGGEGNAVRSGTGMYWCTCLVDAIKGSNP